MNYTCVLYLCLGVAFSDSVAAATPAVDRMFAVPPDGYGVIYGLEIRSDDFREPHEAVVESDGRRMFIEVNAPARLAGDEILVHHGNIHYSPNAGESRILRGTAKRFANVPVAFVSVLFLLDPKLHFSIKTSAAGLPDTVPRPNDKQSSFRLDNVTNVRKFSGVYAWLLEGEKNPRKALFQVRNDDTKWSVSYKYEHTLQTDDATTKFLSELIIKPDGNGRETVRVSIENPILVRDSRVTVHLP